jgi:DNA polymerase I
MAKAVNFGLIYGMSAFGLAAQLNIERGAAQNYIDRYFARYPGVAEYMARTREQAKMDGYVETLFGRRLYLPEIARRQPRPPPGRRTRRDQRAHAGHRRRPDQTGDDRRAGLARRRAPEDCRCTRLIMQVHDELVLEVAEERNAAVRRQGLASA